MSEQEMDAGWDDSGDLAEMSCPECRGTVTEDTQQCPLCGNWITPVDPTNRGWKKLLYVVAIVLMLLVSVLMVWMGVWPQPARFP